MDAAELDRVGAWLAERVEVARPIDGSLIVGGRSNLTYRLEDAGGRAWVLRRPPSGSLDPSAHDMGRETRAIRRVSGSAVPVPSLIGEDDGEVLGVPFYVTEFVSGQALRTRAQAETLSLTARRRVGPAFMATLADLHDLRPEPPPQRTSRPYVARQVQIWRRQLADVRGRELPLMDQVGEALSRWEAPQQETTLVHGDYRLDNVLLGDDGTLRAVLDWELSTFYGDPVADLAMTLVYWHETEYELIALEGAPTLASGFHSRDELRACYEDRTGRDTGAAWNAYVAFSYWKFAAILEGVYRRNLAGAYGHGGDENWKRFEYLVPALAEKAAAALGRH